MSLALIGIASWALAAMAGAPAEAVVSDDERWAAWIVSPGLVVVYDDRTGRRRSLSVPDCPLGGVGGGRIVLQCPSSRPGDSDPILVDIRTGVQTNAGGPELWSDALDYRSFVGVGRYGLLVDLDGYHFERLYAFDLRIRRNQSLDEPDRVVDLNRPALTRRLCDPLRRTPRPSRANDDDPPYLPMASSERWAAEFVPAPPEPAGAVRVWRCGQPRPKVVARCECGDVGIGDGLVTWTGGFRARALDLTSGRRRSWRISRDGSGHIAQAGRTILMWTERPTGDDPALKVTIVRWPRR